MTCKNCGHTLSGKYCSNCGQKSDTQRINYGYLIKEIPNSVFQLNKGFLFTIKELFVRPGHSIRAFIEGKRKPYYKPVAFLIITTTLYVLTAYLMGRNTFLGDIIVGFGEGIQDKNETPDLTVVNWISRNQSYFIILVLPLFSVASYIAFLKSTYNYFEHLVINFYITGQQMIIYLLCSFIFFKENLFLIVPLLIGVIYNFWVFHQVFESKKVHTNLLLVLFAYVIFIGLIFITGLLIFLGAKVLGY